MRRLAAATGGPDFRSSLVPNVRRPRIFSSSVLSSLLVEVSVINTSSRRRDSLKGYDHALRDMLQRQEMHICGPGSEVVITSEQ